MPKSPGIGETRERKRVAGGEVRERKRVASGEVRDRKRERVLSQKRKLPTGLLLAVATVLTIIVMGGIYFATARTPGKQIKRAKVSERLDYTLRDVKMTKVSSEVRDGYIRISLKDVKRNRFVAFWYKKKQITDARARKRPLPLLAIITPSGKLITAVSVCEPCRSETFHTEPDGTLTCNVCYTKWDLETFEGLSGGCPNYPPAELEHKVKDGEILIRESDLLSWKPRVV